MPLGNYRASNVGGNWLLTLLTNARPIVAHPLTVDRSAVSGTSTYSLIHQIECPYLHVAPLATCPLVCLPLTIYLQCRVAFAVESLIVLIGFVSSFRLHKIIVRKRVLLNWKICMSCLSSTATLFLFLSIYLSFFCSSSRSSSASSSWTQLDVRAVY